MLHLAGINRILVSAQLQPVTTEASPDRFVAKAITMLDECVLRELERGWAFNTDYDLPISTIPAGNGTITPAAGTLSIDVRPENCGGKDIVFRDGVLYDRTNRTSTFTEASIKCDVSTTRTFDNCPLVFQEYVVACACVQFASEVSVDRENLGVLRGNQARTWQALVMRDEQQLSTSIYQRWPLSNISRRWPSLLN